MNDPAKYNYERASTEMYGLACKHFHQAKTFYENIPNPNEEVSLLFFFFTLSLFYAQCVSR